MIQMIGCATRAWRKGELYEEGFPIARVSDHLEDPDAVVWVDLCRPDEHELEELAGELGLHALAVEDALAEHQRPKLDRYDTHLFLSTHAMSFDPDAAELETIEIDCFIGKKWLITVRKDEGFSLDPLTRQWDQSADLLKYGVGALLYALLDIVVDGYFDAIEGFDEFYDRVSDGIFEDRPLDPAKQRRWFGMRQSLVRFHRLVVPMREAISSLMRREHSAIPEEMYPYYQDVYDHILRVADSTDALRDLVSAIVETNLSLRDYRQNQVMKKVTSWAAIVAVPTLITGYYGMNVKYPGVTTVWGFWVSVVLMIAASAVLYAVFKRREWL
jgi:magnesium transporter